MTNDVYAKYFIGKYNGDEFPLAIDQCSPFDVLGFSGYQYPTCINETTIALYEYTDSGCSSLDKVKYSNSTWQTGMGTLYDFNCDDDAIEAYVEVEFSAFTCETSSKVTLFAAIGENVCAFVSSDEISISTYCEDGFAELYYFDTTNGNEANCSESRLYNTANATSECGFMVKTSGVKIYGQVRGYKVMV